MSNPLFGMMQNQTPVNGIMQRFQQFQRMFKGDPRQQVQQMLKAIQAQEKATQDKVNKEKAALLKSRQKEKNW